MNALEIYTILLSETEATKEGAEGVYAAISNDYAKGPNGEPIFGKEFGYRVFGTQLPGPIPENPEPDSLSNGVDIQPKLVTVLSPANPSSEE